jgi:hypothetical protein
MNNLLEINGMNKTYGAFALENVSFAVPRGYIMGFASIAAELAENPHPALIWAESNAPAICALACMALALLICASYRLSLAFYRNRDF